MRLDSQCFGCVRPTLAALLLALVLATLSCGAAPYVWIQDYRGDSSQLRDGSILPGDVVEVRVFGQESLTVRETVRADGTLTVPLLGPVSVAGEQPGEAAKNITRRLAPFVTDPRVTVVVQKSIISVTAVGEVEKPGLLELDAPATVVQAVAEAGGLGKFADRSGIFVIREMNGKPKRIRFRYDSLVGGSAKAAAFHLKTGDIVFVED